MYSDSIKQSNSNNWEHQATLRQAAPCLHKANLHILIAHL